MTKLTFRSRSHAIRVSTTGTVFFLCRHKSKNENLPFFSPPSPLGRKRIERGEKPIGRAKVRGKKRDHLWCIHLRHLASVFFLSLFYLRERVVPIVCDELRFSLVIGNDENEKDARGAALCVRVRCEREGPDESARGATYPTRGSELTERDPRARGCGRDIYIYIYI